MFRRCRVRVNPECWTLCSGSRIDGRRLAYSEMVRHQASAHETELERRFLDFAYTTDAPITPGAVAYFAQCSLEQAEALLDRLANKGTLRIENDENGNVYYVLPGRSRLERPAAMVQAQSMPIAARHR